MPNGPGLVMVKVPPRTSSGTSFLTARPSARSCTSREMSRSRLPSMVVIRGADGKRLRLISREVHDLAARARSRQLMPDDVVGGTFTVTNPGPFGTFMTHADHQSASGRDPVDRRDQEAAGRDHRPTATTPSRSTTPGMLVLTWDHRAFDGGYAAAFLGA